MSHEERERYREMRPPCTEKLCACSVITIIRYILFCFRWNAYGDLIHSAILRVVEKGVVRILRPCWCVDGWVSVLPYAFLCLPRSTPTLSGQHSAVFQGVYGRLVQVDSSAFVSECGFLFFRGFSVSVKRRCIESFLCSTPPSVACLCSTPPSVSCLCWAGTFFDTLSARGRVSTGMLLISFLLTRGFILSSENRWCWRRTFHYRFPWMFKRRNWSDGQSWWNGVDLLLILLLNPLCSANI